MNKYLIPAMLVWLFGTTAPVSARTFLRVESSHLGGGVFQYRMTSVADPFWSDVRISSFSVMTFTNRTAYGAVPSHWIADTTNTANRAAWILTNNLTQARPYEKIFLAQSSRTTFKTITNRGVSVTFAAVVQPSFQNESLGNFSGFRNGIPCLVPCPPGEADGSPSVLVSTFDVIPDFKLIGQTVSSNALQGLTFSWTYDSTMRVEGSYDLLNWRTAGYAWGHAPWATTVFPTPLLTNGNYFRLVLLATKQLPLPTD